MMGRGWIWQLVLVGATTVAGCDRSTEPSGDSDPTTSDTDEVAGDTDHTDTDHTRPDTDAGDTDLASDTDVSADTDARDSAADSDTLVVDTGPGSDSDTSPADTAVDTDTDGIVADSDTAADSDTLAGDTDTSVADTDAGADSDTVPADTDTARIDTDTTLADTDTATFDTDTVLADTDTGFVDTAAPVDTADPHDSDPDLGTPCDPGFGADQSFRRGSSCYLEFVTPQTRADAAAACVSLGGTLAKLSDRAENRFAVQSLPFGGEWWIGANDLVLENRFVWEDETPVAYGAWGVGEPNNSSGREDCAELMSSGAWNDLPCEESLAYLCETTTCGDGDLDAHELCDDGNLDDGDGCDSNCTPTACGNGVVSGAEVCDDGNVRDGDGCESDCTFVCGGDVGQSGAWQRGGSCLLRYDQGATWDQAEATCQAAGGHLPTVRSDQTEDWLLRHTSGPFLGLRLDAASGEYAWTSGLASTWTKWDAGEPSVTNACTAIQPASQWWSTVRCNTSHQGFFCEQVTETCGDGIVSGTEQCDDGDVETAACATGLRACTVCSDQCAEVRGETQWCGNGRTDAGESCDDANPNPLDGCDACVQAADKTCVGTPSVCFASEWSSAPALGMVVTDDGYDGTLASMSCVAIDVAASSPAPVGDVAVAVAADMSYVGDLTIKLVSPAGTVATLMSLPFTFELADDGTYDGPYPATWRADADLVATSPVRFVSGSAADAESMGLNLTDNLAVCEADGVCDFAPNPGAASPGGLEAFRGEDAAGTWQVCFGDSGALDEATVDHATLWLNP